MAGSGAAGYGADPGHQGGAFRRGNNAARVHQVEEVRGLEAVVVRREERPANAVLPFRGLETVQEFLGLLFVEFEFGANGGGIAAIKAVLGELLLFHEANVAVGFVRGPAQIVNALDALEECADALEAGGEFYGDGVEVDPADLMEVGDFEAVEQHLPPNAPGAERRGFPVVFFEANVMFLEMDSDSAQALEVEI